MLKGSFFFFCSCKVSMQCNAWIGVWCTEFWQMTHLWTQALIKVTFSWLKKILPCSFSIPASVIPTPVQPLFFWYFPHHRLDSIFHSVCKWIRVCVHLYKASFSITYLEFHQCCVSISLLLLSSIHCKDMPLFVHSVDGHLGHFQFLDMNKTEPFCTSLY